MNGNCLVNLTASYCKCFTGFSGDYCEVVEMSVKIVKSVKMTATIICVVCLVSFGLLVLCNDMLNYFNIGHKRNGVKKLKKEMTEKKLIKTFDYYNLSGENDLWQ